MIKRYYLRYTVKEANGHRYDFERFVNIRPREASKKAIQRFESRYEAKQREAHGIACTCRIQVLAQTEWQPWKQSKAAQRIKTALGALLFWIILLGLLWIGSAPWMK